MLRRRSLCLALATAAMGAGLALPVAPAAATTPTQLGGAGSVVWGPCEDGVEAPLECTTLTVPLDYSNPSGETIDIAVIRLPATNPAREGAILFNPGGPGGSGYDFVANAAGVAQTEMGFGAFDLVGFDPRGVDRSNGLRCLNDEQVGAVLYADDNPSEPAAKLAYEVANVMFGPACQIKYGDTLIHYSTDNTARDMDAIRAALGDDQISYIGISYGTYLGGVYAALFPERVRAMVLDAAFDPTGDSEYDQYVTQLVGFEEAFDNWAAWCEEGSECEFTDVDVAGRWDRLIQELDTTPVYGSDGREVNPSVMEQATISTLYAEMQWPLLGTALADAEQGDGDGLLYLADQYYGRNEDGTFSTSEQSGLVIRCASGLEQTQPADPEALMAQMQQVAPRFTRGIETSDFSDFCRDLFPEVVTATEPVYTGTAPILVVGGLNDPATPFRWSEELTERLEPAAQLLTFTGEGHGQILSSSCVTDLEAAVITDLQLPAPGTVCEPDPPVAEPAFWGQLTAPAGVGAPITNPLVEVTLGLIDTQMYWDSYVLEGDTDAVAAAYGDVFSAAGISAFPPDTTTLPGATTVAGLGPDAMTVLAIIIPSESLTDPESDFAALADVVAPGEGIVVVAALPF